MNALNLTAKKATLASKTVPTALPVHTGSIPYAGFQIRASLISAVGRYSIALRYMFEAAAQASACRSCLSAVVMGASERFKHSIEMLQDRIVANVIGCVGL